MNKKISLILALVALLVACRGDETFSLRETLEHDKGAVRGAEKATIGVQTSDHQRRWGLAGVTRLTLPLSSSSGTLRVSLFAQNAGAQLRVHTGRAERTSTALPAGWSDIAVPLPRRIVSREVTVELAGCSGSCGFGEIWFDGAAPQSARPNLVFILVDTLRADALGTYSGRNETPAIDRLASDGVVFERAIAQASWTLPSTSSLLTGMWPSVSPGWTTPGQGVAASATPLAELLQQNGYTTGGFIANPLLKDEIGFGRGFDAYWAAPTESGVLTTANETLSRAHSWITTHQQKPFFAYIHLMDPHDPYMTPQRRREAGGVVTMGNPDPAFTGKEPLPDAKKVAEWRSLYDEEVRYADEQIEQLLAAMKPEVRANTIFLVTADHGEEFMEHGFLKHAPTLFNEAIHVPLIISGPGASKSKRVPELVRLVDVVPTLAEMLKIDVVKNVSRRWSGVSLAGVVSGKAPMPKLKAYSESFGFGPLRWAVYDGEEKVFFFNKGHKLPSELPAMPFPLQWLEKNLPVEGVYASSRREPLDRLLPADDAKLRAGREEASKYLQGKTGGLWMSIKGDGNGGRLEASLTMPMKDVHVVPFFWRAGDIVKPTATGVEIDVANDGMQRLAVFSGGTTATANALKLVTASQQLPFRNTKPADDAAIYYWVEAEPVRSGSDDEKKELLSRLRALGYIQ